MSNTNAVVKRETDLHILEELQSSQWGHVSIREALALGRELLEGSHTVHVFKRKTNRFHEDNRAVFEEGWKVTDEAPGFYHCIGSSAEQLPLEHFMKTLSSTAGRKRINIPHTTRYWSLYYIFSTMFQGGHNHVGGEVIMTDRELIEQTVNFWEETLANADGRPMLNVLGEYTLDELHMLSEMEAEEFVYHLLKLNQLIKDGKDEELLKELQGKCILLKGLEGKYRAVINRLTMRVGFWSKYAETGDDFFTLAKTYTLV